MDQDHQSAVRIVRIFILLLFAGGLFSYSGDSFSQKKSNQNLRFEGAEIEGRRDKPKDLYILPWRSTELLQATDFPLEFLQYPSSAGDVYQVQDEFEYFQKTRVSIVEIRN